MLWYKDREMLSEEGLFVVVVPIGKDGKALANKSDVVTRGFIYVKGSQDLMDKSRKFVEQSVNKHFSKSNEWIKVKKKYGW